MVLYLSPSAQIHQIHSQKIIKGIKWDTTGHFLCIYNDEEVSILKFGETLVSSEIVQSFKVDKVVGVEWCQKQKHYQSNLDGNAVIEKAESGIENEFKKLSLCLVTENGLVSVWTFDDSEKYSAISYELPVKNIKIASIARASNFIDLDSYCNILMATESTVQMYEIATNVQKRGHKINQNCKQGPYLVQL